MSSLRIAIDCDDAAVDLKDTLLEHLQELGHAVTDLNYNTDGQAMYPEIGYHLACQVQSDTYDRGILICGTGLGMAIVANKVKGVYAGVCHDVYSAERLRKSNAAQIITMGARVVGQELAKTILDAWLHSEFNGGRSQPKIDQLKKLEAKSFSQT